VRVELTVNGAPAAWDVAPGERLLDALRARGCVSVKRGCETGDCGCCTVLLDGEPAASCIVAAAAAHGRTVVTLEGLRDDSLMRRLQDAFLTAGAVQCGYCTPGLLLTAWWLLRDGGPVDESAARHALSGVLCRCTGYVKPLRALLAVAGRPDAPLRGGHAERGHRERAGGHPRGEGRA